MAIDWTTAAWFLPFVIPITIWVSWSDMASMKIPNKAVLALLIVFAVVGLVALPSFSEYLWRWSHFGIVLVVGFILSAIGGVGAGDAKYAAAMAPFVPLGDATLFCFLLGATIIAAFILHRTARASTISKRFAHWESWTHRAFPMGFALAPALLFYLLIGFFTG